MFPLFSSVIMMIQLVRFTVSDVSSLEVVHIIFRHGEKNAEFGYSYPTDPYKNYTRNHINPGQLNKVGRDTMYDLGLTLKQRYSNFLSKNYVENEVEAWASPFPRSIFSLQILMASLFQPTQEEIWNENLNWQPTLFHSNRRNEDRLFILLFSKEYMSVYEKVCMSEANQWKLRKYREDIAYIRKHTELKFECTREAYILYLLLESEVEANLILPEWTRKVYPQPLKQLALIEYEMQISTVELKRIFMGDLLLKILNDTLSRLTGESMKKFHLYSGHDVTIVQALSLLGFDTIPAHIPGYGAYIALEVHKFRGEYVLKVFYRQNKHDELKRIHNRQGRYSIRLTEFEKTVRDLFEGGNSSLKCGPSIAWIILTLFTLNVL